jgi:hypothetical protein
MTVRHGTAFLPPTYEHIKRIPTTQEDSRDMASTKKKVASIAFTGAAATMAVGLAAGPALAATTWHVKNGTAGFTGTVKGKNTTGTTTLKSSGGTVLTCAKSKAVASGNVAKSTVSGSPAAVATLKTGTKFTSCTAPGGVVFSAKLSKSATLEAKSYKSGVTTGTLTGVHAVIKGSSLNSCAATVSGSLSGTYTNATHQLTADPKSKDTLKVLTAKGCGGLAAGKKAYFKGTYVISTPTALTISN